MRSVGITGGIGTGKSIICKIIEKLAYPVFYSDNSAKELMNNNPELKASLSQLLGAAAYENNELNKPFIAEQIFINPQLKNKVNALVHPAVYNAYEDWRKAQKCSLVFNESALLFETGSYKRFDFTILVTANDETRIERVTQRDHISRSKVIERINSQLDDDSKKLLSDYVIENDNNQLVLPQLLEIIKKINIQSMAQ